MPAFEESAPDAGITLIKTVPENHGIGSDYITQ
jgi:hypothetical protein